MALLFIDSGDHVREFSSDKVQVQRKFEDSTIGANSAGTGYENGVSVRSTNGSRLLKPFASTKSTVFVHFKHRFSAPLTSTAASHNAGPRFLLGGSEQVWFKFREVDLAAENVGGEDGSVYEIQVFRGATLVATHGRLYSEYTYAFQFKVTPDPATGAYEIRAAVRQGRFKGPMQVIGSGSGLNLADTGLAGCDQFEESHDTFGGQSEWGDLVVTDDVADGSIFNDFIDDPRIVRAFYPNAIGVDDEWVVQGTTDKVDALNEPAGHNNLASEDGRRVTSENIGDIQLMDFNGFQFTDLDVVGPAGAASVDAVVLYPEAAMESSGTRTYRVLYRDLADLRSNGSNIVLGSTVFQQDRQEWLQNPITASGWTVQELLDAQFGVEIVA